jgi:lipid-A-disaccharide synthase
MSSRTYLFIAGDPSGDLHAAPVVANLRARDPECQCTGIGGPAMRGAGFVPFFPFEPFNRMGFFEVALHIRFFLDAKKKVVKYLTKQPPACLVCVDYSGFNIPVMKAAHARGIPVVWYIAPMVWAWKRKRAAVLAQYARHICCIFPFEVPYFRPYTDQVSFVGNPLIEAAGNTVPKTRTAPGSEPVLAIVPGSRQQEVARLLGPMIGAYSILRKKYPGMRAVISRFHLLPESLFAAASDIDGVELSTAALPELLSRADFALVTSGTATLETALAGVPHCIAYKTSPITYQIFRHFVTIKYIGLPNIIAGEQVAPELIQQYVTDIQLAGEADRFLSDPGRYCSAAEKLSQIRALLGSKKPSEAVAEIIRCSAVK